MSSAATIKQIANLEPVSMILYYEYKRLKTYELNTIINTTISLTQTSSDKEVIARCQRNAQVASVLLIERYRGIH